MATLATTLAGELLFIRCVMADIDCACLLLPYLPFVWFCVWIYLFDFLQMPALDCTWQVQGFIALAWHESGMSW